MGSWKSTENHHPLPVTSPPQIPRPNHLEQMQLDHIGDWRQKSYGIGNGEAATLPGDASSLKPDMGSSPAIARSRSALPLIFPITCKPSPPARTSPNDRLPRWPMAAVQRFFQAGRHLARRQIACVTEFSQVERHDLLGDKLVSRQPCPNPAQTYPHRCHVQIIAWRDVDSRLAHIERDVLTVRIAVADQQLEERPILNRSRGPWPECGSSGLRQRAWTG